MVVEPLEIGHEAIEHKPAPGSRVGRNVAEALHLPFLREQPEQRVERQVDQRKLPLCFDIGEVAHSDLDVLSPGFGLQQSDHFLGDVDSAHLDAPGGQGKSNATGADRQLESPGR